jgi:hypothetical protein
MLDDPSDKVGASAAWWVGRAAPDERKDEAIAALKRLLHDEDKRFREVAVQTLSDYPQAAQEVEDAAIEISRDPKDADAMFSWFRDRKSTSAKVAQRLVEMYDEGYRETSSYGQYYPIDWVRGQVSEEARPVAVKFCVRVARDSTVHRERTDALAGLQSLGDASVIPELEAMANSPDAEGIEDDLARTMGYLRQRANEGR